jgi:hypothetical protein
MAMTTHATGPRMVRRRFMTPAQRFDDLLRIDVSSNLRRYPATVATASVAHQVE